MSYEVVRSQLFSDKATEGAELESLISNISPAYFKSKRWFGSKSQVIKSLKLFDYGVLPADKFTVLAIVQLDYEAAPTDLYYFPLVIQPLHDLPPDIAGQPDEFALDIETEHGHFVGYDAFHDTAFCRKVYELVGEQAEVPLQHGKLDFKQARSDASNAELPPFEKAKRVPTEQSNTSVIYNNALIMKNFRKVVAGKNPDFEIPFFLTTRTHFRNTPTLAGYADYIHADGWAASLGVMQGFVANEGDGWNYILNQLPDYFLLARQYPGLDDEAIMNMAREYASRQHYFQDIELLGRTTGEMHNALASDDSIADFAPERITAEDVQAWQQSIKQLIQRNMAIAEQQRGQYPQSVQTEIMQVVAAVPTFEEKVEQLDSLRTAQACKTRYHGDYHLGQVLKTHDGFVILDFEGEPLRTIEERRAKSCPLKDVAGMMRSLDYAAFSGYFSALGDNYEAEDAAYLERFALAWQQVAGSYFMRGYHEATKDAAYLPQDPAIFQQALAVFQVEKTVYELNYELNNRPTWVPIPLRGLQGILRG